MNIAMEVNGRTEELQIAPDETLLEVLRDKLYLTGTKNGCEEGECGACTVLVDGQPVDSCIYSAGAAHGRSIETIEGLDKDALMTQLQTAFDECGGVQCGYCTPGILMTLVALLREADAPSRAEVQWALTGNICRCTGYVQILDAVDKVLGERVPR